MKALLWLYSVLYLVPYCCVVAQDPREMLQSSSLLPNTPPWETTIEIPWLVSLSGNCQGIVLSGWWILSTANCLKKTELSNLEISGLYDIENILHGQNICLYPKFDSQGGLDPVKADIGLLLLQKPVWDEDITLSQDPNVSLRSCSRCQYRICQVHQYQSNKEFRTARVNKISVKLLDLQVCHHQYSQLEKNEGLCIQSQPRKDCWVLMHQGNIKNGKEM
uniref:Peptidase S1 domain-containing protein n=1 Tax=Castor canadensis TaxID=51338 RepID=A0A8C0X5N4_CASCN